MAVTSITPLEPIIVGTAEVYQGSMLLEGGAYQLYANAGIVGASATLTITVETTAGTTLATLTTTSAPGTAGPSSNFDTTGVAYVNFFTSVSAVQRSAWIKTLSLRKI